MSSAPIWMALGMAFAVPELTGAAAAPFAYAGIWQSAADETPLNAPHQEAVWGKNAKEVRTVRMTVQPTGDATVTVTRRVIDAHGRGVAGTTSIEHIELVLKEAEQAGGPRVELPVTLKRAERRYPDDPGGTWTIDGLRVTATSFPDEPSRLEVRLDFPDGRGSFWETLRRK